MFTRALLGLLFITSITITTPEKVDRLKHTINIAKCSMVRFTLREMTDDNGKVLQQLIIECQDKVNEEDDSVTIHIFDRITVEK